MDDPNDFEWAFPKAKNRASNGTLYDTNFPLVRYGHKMGTP
jgi:hypothetical protein